MKWFQFWILMSVIEGSTSVSCNSTDGKVLFTILSAVCLFLALTSFSKEKKDDEKPQ